MKALFGTYFKILKKAKNKVDEMRKLKREFVILSFKNGYLVVSKKQAEEL